MYCIKSFPSYWAITESLTKLLKYYIIYTSIYTSKIDLRHWLGRIQEEHFKMEEQLP